MRISIHLFLKNIQVISFVCHVYHQRYTGLFHLLLRLDEICKHFLPASSSLTISSVFSKSAPIPSTLPISMSSRNTWQRFLRATLTSSCLLLHSSGWYLVLNLVIYKIKGDSPVIIPVSFVCECNTVILYSVDRGLKTVNNCWAIVYQHLVELGKCQVCIFIFDDDYFKHQYY